MKSCYTNSIANGSIFFVFFKNVHVCVCRNKFGVKRDVVRAYSYVSGEVADIPVVEAHTKLGRFMEALHDQVLQEAPFHNLRYFWKQFHRGNSNDLGFRASGAVKDGYLFGSICFRFRKGDNRNVNVDSAFQAIPVLSFTTNVDETVAGVRKTEVMVCKAKEFGSRTEEFVPLQTFEVSFT